MNFPGFTAELVFSTNQRSHRAVTPAVIFDGSGGAGCMLECMENCQSTGQSSTQCRTTCNRACIDDGPISTPPPPNPNSPGCIGCQVSFVACQASTLGGLFGICSRARRDCRRANNC
jgi:hypothetical protein